jgi:hypothetical protein
MRNSELVEHWISQRVWRKGSLFCVWIRLILREVFDELPPIHSLLTPEEQAFVDLVYAAETAVDLGLANEEQVMPLVIELIGLRETVSSSLPEMLERIQKELVTLVER